MELEYILRDRGHPSLSTTVPLSSQQRRCSSASLVIRSLTWRLYAMASTCRRRPSLHQSEDSTSLSIISMTLPHRTTTFRHRYRVISQAQTSPAPLSARPTPSNDPPTTHLLRPISTVSSALTLSLTHQHLNPLPRLLHTSISHHIHIHINIHNYIRHIGAMVIYTDIHIHIDPGSVSDSNFGRSIAR